MNKEDLGIHRKDPRFTTDEHNNSFKTKYDSGTLKINPKGLMTFAFKFGDLETSYYLVRNQNQ